MKVERYIKGKKATKEQVSEIKVDIKVVKR
jgi:hypothetical protein